MGFLDVSSSSDFDVKVRVKMAAFKDEALITRVVENIIISKYSKVFGSTGSKWRWSIQIKSKPNLFQTLKANLRLEISKKVLEEVSKAKAVMLSYLDRLGTSAVVYSSEESSVTIPSLTPSYLRTRKGVPKFLDLTGETKGQLISTVPVVMSGDNISVSWKFDEARFLFFNLGRPRQVARPVLGIFKLELNKNLALLLKNITLSGSKS